MPRLLRVVFNALLLNAAACGSSAESKGVPVDTLRFESGMLLPSGMLSVRPPLDSFEVSWFSGQLAALHEPRLNAAMPAKAESYRFLWLRSFHQPVVIRIYSTATGGRVVAAVTNGAGGYAPGALIRRDSVELTPNAWSAFRAAIDTASFWTLPAEDSGRVGADGAEWVFEGRHGPRYAVFVRWSPDTSKSLRLVRRLGLAFLRLGRVRVDSTNIY